jgi:RNA polymerase subunit RPABC4/transcription elongation factor Spt4
MSKICKQCGTENNDDSKFCISCGSDLFINTKSIVTGYELRDNYGQVFPLKKSPSQIGSDASCAVCLDETGLPSLLAELIQEEDTWLIEGKADIQIIQINQQNLQNRHCLADGDTIQIGSTVLRYSAVKQEVPFDTVGEANQEMQDLSSFRSSGMSDTFDSGQSGTQAQKVVQKKCNTCDRVIYAAAEICPYCGVRQQTVQISNAPIGKHSRITAAWLALLLGGVGAHKFYLGKPIIGLIYLVFVWAYVPAILGIIEGIMYFSMTDEKFAEKYG